MKLYRALVRVLSVENDPVDGEFFQVLVPASLCKQPVRIAASRIPQSVEMRPGSRLFARATLDATTPEEMRIEAPYEIALLPDPNDGLA